ncbi:HAD-IIIA family hydrolase [bacterium]|nr:HAD-IIIA family hydrolase [bacterium]
MEEYNIAPMVLPLRMLIVDIDGVLSDGKIIYGTGELELKNFCVKDGLGLYLLTTSRMLQLAIITGKDGEIIKKRGKELGASEIYTGYSDKIVAYEKILEKHGLTDNEVAFIGDDIIDIPVMQRVGFAVAPRDAVLQVKEVAHYVTRSPAGRGAVREVAELIFAIKKADFHRMELSDAQPG